MPINPEHQFYLKEFPVLTPLLTAFEQRDRATFLHSVAVHFVATKLAHDLYLLFSNTQNNKKIAQNWITQLKPLAPFWLLHDIGKTASSKDIQDYSISQNRVHPIYGQNRSSYETGMHYLHPQQSGHLISIWSKNLPIKENNLRKLARNWAKLSYFHDNRLNSFLKQNQNLSMLEKQALLLFSVSDISVAMRLPRPNKPELSKLSNIKSVIYRDHLTPSNLKQLFPQISHYKLQEFIFASITHSLQTLELQFPSELLTTQNQNPNFKKTLILDQIIAIAWKKYEKDWEQTLLKMYNANCL